MEDKREGGINKKTLFLFGLAGVGKSYLAKYLSAHHGFYQYEGDDDVTPAMRQAIETGQHFTNEMRAEFVGILANKILELQRTHEKIVVSQGLYKNAHRKYLLDNVPNLQLVWVKASDAVMLERIKARGGVEITEEYAKSIRVNFEEPDMEVLEVVNDGDVEGLDWSFAR